MDPAEQKRMETRSRLEEYVDQLKQQVGVCHVLHPTTICVNQNDEYTAEIEKIVGEGGREKGGIEI